MRVLHVVSSSGMFGAESLILNLASRIPSVAASIAVFAKSNAGERSLLEEAQRRGLQTYSLPDRLIEIRQAVKDIAQLCGSTRAEILQTHGYKSNVLGALAARSTMSAHHIATQHGFTGTNAKSRAFGLLDRRVARLPSVKRIAVVSHQLRVDYLKAGVSDQNIAYMPNGILIPSSTEDRKRRPKLYDLSYVGRLSPEKGVDILIRAIASIDPPRPTLAVIGSGPLMAPLKALATSLSLDGSIYFLGYHSDPWSIATASRLLVLPSRTEGMPLALLEAMAREMPVIASNVGDIPLVVKDDVTGLLVPPGHVEALAVAIEASLSDKDKLATWGTNARALVKRDYNLELCLKRWQTLYQQVLAGDRHEVGAC